MPSSFKTSTFTRRDVVAGIAFSATAVMAQDLDAPPASSASPHPCASTDAPLRELTGRVAFITGGSSGIGLGIAQACIQAGMKVVITYRSKEHLRTALKTLPADQERVHAVEVDVTDAPTLRKAAEECVARFGKVHLLVNNAGVQNRAPLSSISREQWDLLMNVNVGGVLNCVQTFLPHLTQHNDGSHIVTTSSILGLFTLGRSNAAYCASKFAVIAMMEALRAELADSRVGVSVLCPGVVKSDLEPGLANIPGASDPYDVGVRLLESVRRNDLYVLTHPEFEAILRDRHRLLERSGRPTFQVSEARQALANGAASSAIYARELARSAC